MQFNILSCEGGSKNFKSNVIFELINQLLSFLYLCNEQSLLLKETLILSLQNSSYFEHLIIQVQKSSEHF
jgi:hypothetical protein